MEIRILKWKEYNPRADLKHPGWFRLNHNIVEDPDFYSFSHSEIWAFIYILSMACKKNSGLISLNLKHAEVVGRLNSSVIFSAIEKLSKIQILEVTRNENVTNTSRRRNVNVTHTSLDETRRDETRRDETSIVAEQDKPVTALVIHGNRIDEKLYLGWTQTYGKEWVDEEIKKAGLWVLANPKRAPKSNYRKFLNDWLARGWERHRKTIPANKPTPSWLQKMKEEAENE